MKKWKPARYLYIYFNNLYFIYNFTSKLEADYRNHDSIILIHTMGKVGSSTIENSLRSLNLDTPIYKTHYLNPQTIEEMWNIRVKMREKYLHRHYLANKYIGQKLEQSGLNNNKWKVISLVREPIITNISRLFQSIEEYIPNFYQELEKGMLNMEKIIEVFFKEFPYHRWNLNWFDNEVKSVFGIDVLSGYFDKKKGFKIYKEKNVDLLVIKLEFLKSSAKVAFKEFMDIEDFSLISKNVAENKRYRDVYKKFIESIVFPKNYVEELLSHKYTKQFYSENEIAKLMKKWTRD